MKYVITLAILVCFSIALVAQTITEFPTEQEAFLKEVDKYMKDTKRDDCKATAEAFLENVSGGTLSADQVAKVIESSNIMLERKLKAYPHFNDYLNAINTFAGSGKSSDVFNTWSKTLNTVMTEARRGSSKDFVKYISFSEALFRDNTFYSSQAKNWRSSSNDWKMIYDSVPKVVFPEMELIAYTKTDTAKIYNTSGTYYILDERWEGNKGKVDWTSVGLEESQAYATFGNYTIDVTELEYIVEDVDFNYPKYFTGSLKGTYINKLTPVSKDQSYPRFISSDEDLKINDFGENIKYEGEFALFGREVSGSGTSDKRSTFTFYLDNGTKVLRAQPKIFTLKESGDLSMADATAALYLGADSIYHPGLRLVYKIEKKELALYKGEQGVSSSDFFDSYHNMEIDADQIIWNLDENEININMMSGAGKKPSTFRSANFFMKGELEKMQAPNIDYNPVSLIKIYAEEVGSNEIYADNLAKRMNSNYSESTIKGLLFRLVEEGYIYYQEEYSLITIKDKTFNFVLANADKIDFDVLQLNSFSTGVNGKINLENFDIDLVGVQQVTLSDSQNVMVFPKDDSITLQKEQDLKFDGIVFAGNIDFDGSGFSFDYEKFQVDLTELASAIIYVETDERDEQGEVVFKPMTSRIEGLSGFLEIDEPDNKSGRKPNPQYPIYTNREISYVYYENIHDSAYVKDRFFFEIDPFVFDSLAAFDPYLSDLEGQLVSADIFPNFRENLNVQTDLSWGFQRTTPTEGFPIYKGIGTFTDTIWLSNAGLRGKGTVDYLFTNIASDSIIFFPDSMDAITDSFNIEKTEYQGATFPIVNGVDNDIHWLPYSDSMFIKMRSTPFVMYELEAAMKGDLVLTTKGLRGDGAFEFNEASLTSNQFNFAQDDLWADTMGLEIKAIDADKATFSTPNVNGKVDLANKLGTFTANEQDIAMEFANNQYITSINEFFWDMEANRLDFKAPPGTDGSYFTSVREDQDSLKFLGKEANFDMSSSIIKVKEVPEVLVADASIVPDSGRVTIMPGGLLDSLVNAEIIADTATRLHRIYNADVQIHSKNGFTGSGTYDYTYGGGESQPINMHKVGVQESEGKKKTTLYKTFANGIIEEDENFMLHPTMRYKGMVDLVPGQEHLIFSGFGQFTFADTSMESSWFSFKDEIDPENITVRYEAPVNDSGVVMEVGFNFNPIDSISLYPLLMAPARNEDDQRILSANGIMRYNATKQVYTFGDSLRINGKRLGGNVVKYYEADRKVIGQGAIDLGMNFAPIEIVTAGEIEHLQDDQSSYISTFLAFDLPVDKTVMEQFAKDLNSFSFDRPFTDYTSDKFQSALASLVDAKKEKKELEELLKTGQFVVPKDLSNNNLIFSNVKFYYDPMYQIYRSEGPISVAYVGEQGIHRDMVGYIEFGIRRGNDFFNIYLESSFDDWYYFTYNNKTLQMVGSNEDFNKMIALINPEKRKVKLNDQEFFFYTISTSNAMQSFLNRMRQIEAGTFTDFNFGDSESDQTEDELDDIFEQLMQLEDQTVEDDEVITLPEGVENTGEEDLFRDNAPDPAEDEWEIDDKKKGKKGKKDMVDDPIQEMFDRQKAAESQKQETPPPVEEEEKPATEEEDLFKDNAPDPEEDELDQLLNEIEDEGKKNKKGKKEEAEEEAPVEESQEDEEDLFKDNAPDPEEDELNNLFNEETETEDEDKDSKKGKKNKKDKDEEEESTEEETPEEDKSDELNDLFNNPE